MDHRNEQRHLREQQQDSPHQINPFALRYRQYGGHRVATEPTTMQKMAVDQTKGIMPEF